VFNLVNAQRREGSTGLPARLAGRRYYLPTDQGLEARIRARRKTEPRP